MIFFKKDIASGIPSVDTLFPPAQKVPFFRSGRVAIL